MPNVSVHLGLNQVDPKHYAGWSGVLTGCIADAEAMTEICGALGYQTTALRDGEVTRRRVLDALAQASRDVGPGERFVLTYAGHGGQLPDRDADEDDGADETWCLYDGELLDDELYDALAGFPAGARVLVVSDSCHSGTVVRLRELVPRDLSRFRAAPPRVMGETYRQNRTFYDDLAEQVRTARQRSDVRASVILMSGCQDNQLSADGPFNGLFTSRLLQVWDQGRFTGGHRTFWQRIVSRMPPDQSPNFFTIHQDPPFEALRPFGPAAGDPAPRPTRRRGVVMTNETRSDVPEVHDTLAESQRDLQHQLLRALVEAPEGTYDVPHLAELRALAERRARGDGVVRSRGGDTVLIDFAVKVITEAMSALIADFDFLRHPAKGYVSWYNDTDAYVHVLTFDQDDAVRWVPYEDRIVAPRQVVKITARGDRIHVKTVGNNATYDCDKAQAYLFTGTNCYPRVG